VISFSPTEEQSIARDMLDAFARDMLRPGARDADRAGRLEDGMIDALAATGLIDLALEPADGARTRISDAIALESIARGDAAFAVALAAPLGFVRALMDHGTPEQRASLSRRWSTDPRRSAAILVHEPVFGFDPAAPAARVDAEGDAFVLSGVKSFVPRAGDCAEFLVIATDPHGLSAWIVPVDAPGVTVQPSDGTLGLRALAPAEVRFADVRLTRDARLGGDGGCDVQMLIDAGRVANAAILTGVAGAVFDHLLPYLKQRVAHGSALAQKQSVAFRLADMRIDIPSMRWMVWRAADVMDKGRPATRDARLAQLHCTEQAMWITDEGVQLMGGHGYLRDNPVERWYRDVRTLAALEGIVGL
jgi:alkylation response protein AidB-like acyl-CoA dehydrogenase